MDTSSTCYVLLSSENYTVFSKRNKDTVNQTYEVVHRVSLYFDTVVYQERAYRFLAERKFFGNNFKWLTSDVTGAYDTCVLKLLNTPATVQEVSSSAIH